VPALLLESICPFAAQNGVSRDQRPLEHHFGCIPHAPAITWPSDDADKEAISEDRLPEGKLAPFRVSANGAWPQGIAMPPLHA